MATTIEFLLLVVRRTSQCEIHAFGRTVLLLLLLLFLRLTHSFNNTLFPIEWSHFAVCLLNQILCMNVSQFSAHVSSYLFLIQLFRQENIKIISKVVEKSLSLSAHQARAFATLETSRECLDKFKKRALMVVINVSNYNMCTSYRGISPRRHFFSLGFLKNFRTKFHKHLETEKLLYSKKWQQLA